MYLRIIFALTFSMLSSTVTAQSDDHSSFFIGYETFEKAMNKFQNFAEEVGYRFNDKNQIRLMIGEVKLTERHLSSSREAAAVDGDNVEGYFRIYEPLMSNCPLALFLKVTNTYFKSRRDIGIFPLPSENSSLPYFPSRLCGKGKLALLTTYLEHSQ